MLDRRGYTKRRVELQAVMVIAEFLSSVGVTIVLGWSQMEFQSVKAFICLAGSSTRWSICSSCGLSRLMLCITWATDLRVKGVRLGLFSVAGRLSSGSTSDWKVRYGRYMRLPTNTYCLIGGLQSSNVRVAQRY